MTNKNPNLKIMSRTVLLKILSRLTRRRSGKYDFFQRSQVRCFDFDQIRLWGATSLWGSTRGLYVLLYDEIKIMKTHYNMVIQCKNLISLYILPDQRRVNLPSTVF